MVASFRFVARNAFTNCRWYMRTPPIAAWKAYRSPNASHPPCTRSLQVSATRTVASVAQNSSLETPGLETSSSEAFNSDIFTSVNSTAKVSPWEDPTWRHPTLGFAGADLPHLISIRLPLNTTKDDVKVLLSRAGLAEAQLTMYYEHELGRPLNFCYVRIADEDQVDAAIAAISRFTLLGHELTAERYTPEKANPLYQPSLFRGWQPSPTNDLSSRVIRPPTTTPPKLLAPLLAEQWLQILNLPQPNGVSKDEIFQICRELYKRFYQYDVVAISSIRKHHNSSNGWHCKVLFGSPKEMKAARVGYSDDLFMGRVAKAKTYRSGPDVHQKLWECRKSIPEGTSEREVGEVLEEKYKELLYQSRPVFERAKYPTPESAVALKDEVPSLE